MKIKFLALTFSFFISLSCFSQNNPFFVGISDTSKASYTINFKIVNNLVILPLIINNSDTLNFILDTGIKTTLLTDFSDTISFNVGKEHVVRGLGVGDDLIVYHTYGNTIKIGSEILMTHQNIFVLDNDKFELSRQMGMTINGIIGYSIFQHFVVKIDYETKKIQFYNPSNFKEKRKYKRWVHIPLKIYNGKPYTKLKIYINQDTAIYSNLLVDLGASDALWLMPESNDSIPPNRFNKNLYLGQGLNGDIYGYQGKVSKVVINNKNILKKVTVSYPDTMSLKMDNTYDLPNRGGTIGSEILSRFDIIFDYPNNRMLLKRNSRFNRKFNFDLSGIDVEKPYPNLNVYTVFNVHKNSPADDAGIMVGDQIKKIAGKPALNIELNDIIMIFQSKEGRKVKLLLNRNGIDFETTIVLKDYRTNYY